jgi:hypothetical protein
MVIILPHHYHIQYFMTQSAHCWTLGPFLPCAFLSWAYVTCMSAVVIVLNKTKSETIPLTGSMIQGNYYRFGNTGRHHMVFHKYFVTALLVSRYICLNSVTLNQCISLLMLQGLMRSKKSSFGKKLIKRFIINIFVVVAW